MKTKRDLECKTLHTFAFILYSCCFLFNLSRTKYELLQTIKLHDNLLGVDYKTNGQNDIQNSLKKKLPKKPHKISRRLCCTSTTEITLTIPNMTTAFVED